MRSAGCIVNDILDKEFDKKVSRTKNRPIASGKVSIKLSLAYVIFLCLIALLVLLNFNTLTIVLALGSMPLAFVYPLMKRYTYWPQLFLGITFNYGLILGWVCIKSQIDMLPIIFYVGAIFWTLGFDTIYGYQDIKDDEIIGVKSTSIKFKKNPELFLIICYLIFMVSLFAVGLFMKFSSMFYLFLSIPILHLFLYQIYNFNFKNPKSSLKIFKTNNLLGAIVLFNILIGKI
jgi:4-hydroxybenzoate polyprenyltransferase